VPFDAKVVRVGSLGDSGVTAGIRIGLDNGRGLAAFLHHLVREEVSQGQQVRACQFVGLTGIAANAALQEHFDGRRWLNYLGDDEGNDAIRDAYGPNYDRLVEVKRKYDPQNVFHLNHNIAP
jgi:hypothetical protein